MPFIRNESEMKLSLPWPTPLQHCNGAPSNLEGIDVFFDFNWISVVGHPQVQFPFGQCLARRVVEECPQDLKPALLLTTWEDAEERAIEVDGFYLVVVNFDRYRLHANADASAAYFGKSLTTGLTRIRQLDGLADLSKDEVEALIDMKQSREAIERWVSGNEKRVEQLREVVAANTTPLEEAPLEGIAAALKRLDELDENEADQFSAELSDGDKERLAVFIRDNGLLPDHLLQALEIARRERSIDDLATMLEEDLTESPWQKWFENNDWVLGTEFVRILDEKSIDVDHIADYLMQAYDGFLDLIEIKRPEGKLKFWADALDHGNYVPHSDLIKAITQANCYLLEVEKEANSLKFLERLDGVKAIKPRCVLIFGRSVDWNDQQREAYRILNASYHSLSILTFDHVLERAKRVLALVGGGAGGPRA